MVDTRVGGEEGESVRRRRRCLLCDRRFTTYERFEGGMPRIVKRSGERQEYCRGKLEGSLLIALRKRPVSTEKIDQAIHAIESRLFLLGEREISAECIGEWAMQALCTVDKVAWVRFASVYRNFEDIDEFRDALKEINTLTPPT